MRVMEIAQVIQNAITQYAVQPLLILLVGIFVGKLLEQTLFFASNELELPKDRASFVIYTLVWLVYVGTVLSALASIGLLHGTLWLLAGVIITMIVVSVLLNIIDFFPNFAQYHAVKVKYKPGSAIKTRFGEGTVVKVELVDTHFETSSGDAVYIPNRTVLASTKKK